MGVVVRRYIDILIIIINFPYSTCISSFFSSCIPTSLFIFKMFFRSWYMYVECTYTIHCLSLNAHLSWVFNCELLSLTDHSFVLHSPPLCAHQIKVIVFDKTGTLTYGRPEVVRVILFVKEAVCPTALFTAIMGLAESRSEHPLGIAVADFARNVSDPKLCWFIFFLRLLQKN